MTIFYIVLFLFFYRMFMLKKFIPNFVTLLNLLSGCIALVLLTDEKFEMAFYFVLLGIFFDFFDGFFARLLKAYSELGLQLDSLADMVTSGIVPGFAIYMLLTSLTSNIYLPFIGFIITLGAAYRLAKFNISTDQSEEFIGLPTPANTLLIMGFILLVNSYPSSFINSTWFIVFLSTFSAIIQNSPIKLFSLKIKKFDLKTYPFQFVFIFCSIMGIIIFQLDALPFIIIFYMLLSTIKNSFYVKKAH